MKALANEGQHEVAMALLSKVQHKRRRASNVDRVQSKGRRQINILFNMAVKACEKAGDWRAALSLLRTMQTSPDLRPDLFTFNTVMAACEKAGQVQAVSRRRRRRRRRYGKRWWW